jgi:hypothetical protein
MRRGPAPLAAKIYATKQTRRGKETPRRQVRLKGLPGSSHQLDKLWPSQPTNQDCDCITSRQTRLGLSRNCAAGLRLRNRLVLLRSRNVRYFGAGRKDRNLAIASARDAALS